MHIESDDGDCSDNDHLLSSNSNSGESNSDNCIEEDQFLILISRDSYGDGCTEEGGAANL